MGKGPTKSSMLLYGKNSVFERLKAAPQSIKKVFLLDNFDAPHIEELIKKENISCVRLGFRELNKIKPSKDLQGIVAQVDSFRYADFDSLLEDQPGKQAALIFLDRINDPQNLGAIIRTAACFGGFAVVIPKFEACEVTEAVLHVASGGENFVPVSLVSNLANCLIKAKKKEYWVIGGIIGEEAQYLNKISIPYPLALVLGSEGGGIRHGLEKHLDIKARIPMSGAALSFNVAQACAVFCYEIVRQRENIY
ncbi:TrmH family RNA methyltransferase [Candidatus Omnitrophota bacterium]